MRIIIDGDALTYHSSKETIEESIEILDEKIQTIFTATKGTSYIIFLSNTPYFRHIIYPEYKAQRSKYKSPLKWLKTLKAYLKENYNTYTMKDVEADDLCAYEIYRLRGLKEKVVLCSPDKDLLKSIPGSHFNYKYNMDKGDVVKGTWEHTMPEDALKFFWTQMLEGDTADNIKGVDGIGKVGAKKIVDDVKYKNEYPGAILNIYIQKYGTTQGVYEYQKNFRCLYMLSTEKDYLREIGRTVPVFEYADIPKPTEECEVF